MLFRTTASILPVAFTIRLVGFLIVELIVARFVSILAEELIVARLVSFLVEVFFRASVALEICKEKKILAIFVN